MIRRAETREDFELCADIFASVEPEERVTADQVASASGALLVGADGGGYAYVTRSSVATSAFAMIRVRPSARRNGRGAALLAAAAEHAAALGRSRMWGRVHDGDAGSLRFVTGRGFEQIGRDVDVRLCVAAADGGWAPGIVELEEQHLRGAYDVVVQATPEMAVPQTAVAPPFSEWLEQEARLAATAVVALDGDEVVGYARLYRMPGHERRLENGLTAVKKSHRRRGIATAMKRAQIAWARDHGYTEIDSTTVEANAAMRGVNERLGYVPLPASLVVEGWPA